jgi:hypothetical protein
MRFNINGTMLAIDAALKLRFPNCPVVPMPPDFEEYQMTAANVEFVTQFVMARFMMIGNENVMLPIIQVHILARTLDGTNGGYVYIADVTEVLDGWHLPGIRSTRLCATLVNLVGKGVDHWDYILQFEFKEFKS